MAIRTAGIRIACGRLGILALLAPLALAACGSAERDAASAAVAQAPAATIMAAVDLGADSGQARQQGIPLLLVVTRELCGYCDQLKAQILRPMLLSGEYEDLIILRELNIDSETPIRGFDGRAASGYSVASGYDALFTPTVLFLGPEGEEVAQRMIGINTVEMYGYYLDQAIAGATAAIREGRQAASGSPRH